LEIVYTTEAAYPEMWEGNHIQTENKKMVDNAYWPKVVRLNDRLVILVGGTSDPKSLFDLRFKPPRSYNCLIGIGEPDSFIYNKEPLDDIYRNHPACAFHRETTTLYMIGGAKNGSWTNDVVKFNLSNGKRIRDIPELDMYLIGPNALILDQSQGQDQENSIRVLYVSGQN